MMEDPTERFGHVISRVDDARNMVHEDRTGFLPILDGKVLNINMAGTLGGNAGVNDFDGRLIVFVDRSRGSLGKTKLMHDSAQVAGVFSSGDGSEEFSLSRTGGSNRLGLTPIRNSATA